MVSIKHLRIIVPSLVALVTVYCFYSLDPEWLQYQFTDRATVVKRLNLVKATDEVDLLVSTNQQQLAIKPAEVDLRDNLFALDLNDIRLPMEGCTLPLEDIVKQQWLGQLKNILTNIDPLSGPISLTTSDYNFREILLNWLSASMVHIDPGLSNVVVLCMDESLYHLLREHKLNAIYVPPESFMNSATMKNAFNHIAFTATQLIRLTVMRLLNYWGYDAANYDVDALIMQNPEPLYYGSFKDSNFIGSYGHMPHDIRVAWGGITVCAGAFMVKTGPLSEIFWKAMTGTMPDSYNDQNTLNHALFSLNIDWGTSNEIDIFNGDWHGTSEAGFKITIISAMKFCRQACNRHYKYYVWHKGGKGRDGKVRYASQARLWFLRQDWEMIANASSAVGNDWLRELSDAT